MSRESEKVLKELQKFLDAHAEDTKNEADADALTERFFAEYNKSLARSRSMPASFGQRRKPGRICVCAIHTSMC